jgi:D-methionine transport system permease protein
MLTDGWNLLDNPVIAQKLPEATAETLLMVGFAAVITALVGLPLGLLLQAIRPEGLTPFRPASASIGLVVNVGRRLLTGILNI